MSNSSIPPYKPPKELQNILDQQGAQRKRTAQLPKRNWIHKNPRTFQISFITISMFVLFSKPLYDCFFATPFNTTVDTVQFIKRE